MKLFPKNKRSDSISNIMKMSLLIIRKMEKSEVMKKKEPSLK